MKVFQHYVLELEEGDDEVIVLKILDDNGLRAECWDDGTVEVFGDEATKPVAGAILKELGLA